jgi:hypothetical protein
MLSARRAVQGAPRALLLAGLIALASEAAALAAPASQAADDAGLRAAAKALIKKGGADSLEAAALLATSAGDRLALIERAAGLAPHRPDIAWLNLQLCAAVPSCDPRPAEARLRSLDSGNAAGWSQAVARAHRLDDAAAERAALHAMAHTQRFDVYWNGLIVHATDALLGTGTLDQRNALVAVTGVAAVWALPALGEIGRQCRQQAAADAVLRTDCERIAAAMRNGDTYLIKMEGASIARRLSPQGSAENRDADNELQTLRYQMSAGNAVPASRLESDADARQLLQALRTHRTEQEVFVAQLVAAGVDAAPPAGWKDRYPEPQ